jgi:hypothetical protein
MNARELRRRRAAAQLFYRSEQLSPEAVVSHMLAVQSQERRGGLLALRARSQGFTAADVEQRLVHERSLVICWLMRGTVHMTCHDDYPWLLALTAPTQATSIRTRIRQHGISEAQSDKAVALIDRMLREEGPLDRPAIKERLERASIPIEGYALAHLLGAANYAGIAVVGPQKGGRPVHVSVADWFGEDFAQQFKRVDRDGALGELARRFLVSRGPATAADISYWAKLPLRDSRRGLELIASEIVELGGELVDLKQRSELNLGRVPARLLHTFDDYMLSWKDRSFMLPDAHRERVVWGGGTFAQTAIADGVVAAGWTAPMSKRPFAVNVEPFESLSRKVSEELEREAADVARFEGR